MNPAGETVVYGLVRTASAVVTASGQEQSRCECRPIRPRLVHRERLVDVDEDDRSFVPSESDRLPRRQRRFAVARSERRRDDLGMRGNA
jgi:hypothetical protein